MCEGSPEKEFWKETKTKVMKSQKENEWETRETGMEDNEIANKEKLTATKSGKSYRTKGIGDSRLL